MADEEGDQETRRVLDLVHLQSMIDISADRLEGLRTQCATSVELTQQEIRTLEGKLIKLYSRQLVTKAKVQEDAIPTEMKHVPSLKQWLQVVGLSPESIRGVCQKVTSLESLQDKSEHELRNILSEKNAREEEVRRLIRALHNLKKYTEILVRGEVPSETGELALYWDSWDRHQVIKGSSTSPRPLRGSRVERCSVPSEDCLSNNNNNHLGGSVSTLATASSTSSITSLPPQQAPLSPPLYQCTPPSTPPITKGKGGDRGKFPTTPPPCKKHQTGLQQSGNLLPDAIPLHKSKSHESQLANRVEGNDNLASTEPGARRGRLPTEPGPYSDYGHISPVVSSPVKSPPYTSGGMVDNSDDNDYKSTLQVPKSPHTPTISRGMGHVIKHRFTKTFKMMTTCDFCDKQMFIGTGLKCKECKYKCHRDCESKVPPSCGLPPELVDEFRRALNPDDGSVDMVPGYVPNQHQSPVPARSSPIHITSILMPLSRSRKRQQYQQPTVNIPPFPQGPDSSSNTSSCNSSTPSSPALVMTSHTPHATTKQQFHFPDVSHLKDGVTLETHPLNSIPPALEEMVDTHKSNDSDRTVSVSGSGSISTDSERTPVRVDSQDSQVSDGEAVERSWPRQNSLSMREWDIPYDELKIGEPIGTGRFGTVYRGNWHGDVAIKVLNMDYLDDEKTLEAFKLEVATFRKTRHENLVLFMGACMKLPRLAIVTSMCKGMTLYTHIHLRKDKFNMNRTTMLAQQISQGMGYLHARGIVHKDLKSKNIFVENGKVVITDFGLFSVTKLCFGNRKGNGLNIPPGWLCYLAPEIVRSLRVRQKNDEDELPFTKASDVYAFGTVWYELLCGEWPFKAQPPEAIIWQVGKGMKQSLANLQASRDVKAEKLSSSEKFKGLSDSLYTNMCNFQVCVQAVKSISLKINRSIIAIDAITDALTGIPTVLKDILMLCWSYRPGDRPDFVDLLKTLDKLPKKRLARSPSHPIHLSRSAESVF